MAHVNVPNDRQNQQAPQGQEFAQMVERYRQFLVAIEKVAETQTQITDDNDFATKYGITVGEVAQIRAVTGSAVTEANATFLTQLTANYN